MRLLLATLFAVIIAMASAAPQQRIIEKTIIRQPGFGGGFNQGGGFNGGFNGGLNRGGFNSGFNGGFNRGPGGFGPGVGGRTVIKETIIRPGFGRK